MKYLFYTLLLLPVLSFGLTTGSMTKANIVIVSLNNNHWDQASVLFKEEPELLFTPNSSDITPLGLAVKKNNVDMIRFLIDQGAPLSSPFYSRPLLVDAIYMDSQQALQTLLQNGSDADGTYRSLSLLHLCVLLNRLEAMKILLHYKVETEQLDSEHLTPFHMAVLELKWDFIRLLLPVTSNLNSIDKHLLTPLLFFVYSFPDKMDDFLNLIGKSRIQSIINFQTRTIQPPLMAAIDTNNKDVLKSLLEQGANVNIRRLNDKSTPLIKAIQSNNPEIVETLLDYGANIQLQDKHHKTAMAYAKVIGNNEILDLLNKNNQR